MTAHGRVSPAEFQVMLALADGPKHGRAIKADVNERSGGQIDMGPGTLYGAIKRLLRNGWIEEIPEGVDDGVEDERRRYYVATATGMEEARAEARRLTTLLGIALDKALISG